MAVSTPYATLSDYLELFGSADDADPGVINRALLQASRMIDRYCGRFFSMDAAVVARTYRVPSSGSLRSGYGYARDNWAESENPFLYGGYSRLLTVDDLAAAPTEVILDQDGNGSFVGETALASTDYELWPTTASYGPEPKPWQQIAIVPTSSVGGFRSGMLVRVTAKWGWPAVPEPVVRATCELASTLRLAFDPALVGVRSKAIAQGPSVTYAATSGPEQQTQALAGLAAYVKAPLL